ncbi:hypothetical protein [Streptomyces sp. SGAir0957]
MHDTELICWQAKWKDYPQRARTSADGSGLAVEKGLPADAVESTQQQRTALEAHRRDKGA